MANLTLELEVPKTEVIRGESIRFVLNLVNTGDAPVTTVDATPDNRAFRIRVSGGYGVNASGDQMSIQEREGEHIDEPRETPQSILQPKEKMTVRGDVMAWIGELAPGTYTLQGHHFDLHGNPTDSKAVEIKVAEAAPVYARTAVQNVFLSYSPRSTAWIHESGGGADLFFLQSSPANPAVTYSNLPMARLDTSADVFPSSFNISAPRIQHLLWASPNGNLQVIRFRSDLPPEAPLSLPLPHEDLQPIATPYSDEKGNLHALLATADGSPACLFQLIGKGTPAFHNIQAVPPLEGPRGALWYKDEVLAFAWVEPEGKDVYAAIVPLDAPPKQIPGKKIFTAGEAIIDLTLAQRFNAATEKFDRLAFVLGHDMVNDILLRWRINLADGQVEEENQFVADGIGNLRILQCVITDELAPLYLFAGPDGSVRFADSNFSAFVPVLNEMRKPVRAADFPGIVIPSRFSSAPGKYVRHIEQGKRLAWVKLP